MYIFNGTDTTKKIKYSAQANTLIELYQELIDRAIISTYDGDPYDAEILEKYGKSYDDFLDKDGDYSHELFCNWADDKVLTDNEILLLIAQQNGKAYYQSIEEI